MYVGGLFAMFQLNLSCIFLFKKYIIIKYSNETMDQQMKKFNPWTDKY